VSEEDLAYELTAAAHARLLEHALQMLLDGVLGQRQGRRDLGGRAALEDEASDVLLALGQAVRRH
jgi:hypothetical protein